MGCRTFELLEQARVRRHFRLVVAELRASDVSDLSVEQREARAAILDEVERYGQRGVFPKNRHSPDAMAPTFIDEEGTRCAVAHLLESTGAAPIASQIARTHNFARVPALATDASLADWLGRSGLTVADAARIQPSYCHITPASCFCGSISTATGVTSCWSASSSFAVSTAVDAIMAEAESASCTSFLHELDESYTEDSCEEESGCSVAHGTDPVLLGALLFAAGLRARRRALT